MQKFVSILLLALFACIQDNPSVNITNKCKETYDSVKVFSTPNTPTIFKNIEPSEMLNGQIYFDKKNTSDGAYTIQIYKDGEIVRNKCFGYYTNGKSLNRSIKIIIEPDTLAISLK